MIYSVAFKAHYINDYIPSLETISTFVLMVAVNVVIIDLLYICYIHVLIFCRCLV